MATLIAIGAREEDDIVREVDNHNGGDVCIAILMNRWLTTVKGG